MIEMVTRNETLGFLKRFTHGSRTNLEKGTMTNHDALAYVFFRCGTIKVHEAISILREWRTPERAYTYLFNTSASGGYGFTAMHFTSPGQWMHITKFAAWRADNSEKIKGETYFRRHYWYRTARGTYAPTLECFRRMHELNATQCSISPDSNALPN